MTVAEAIGAALVRDGVSQVFGVVGSGNYRVTNAMVAMGAGFVAARHEAGAASMADAYTRISGRTAAVSVHQGPGFTNALTAVIESAKSHTPMLVLAPETPDTLRTSNFWIDQMRLAEAAGCAIERVVDADTALVSAARSVERARSERSTVVLLMPTGLLDEPWTGAPAIPHEPDVSPLVPGHSAVERLVHLIGQSRRPVFIAGRGSLHARAELVALAQRCGALLATSAVARGLFEGDPWSIDVAGGFATPAGERLLKEADLVVAWGASLNRWTTRGGELLQDATVVQIDDRPGAFKLHREVDTEIVGDVAETARRALARLPGEATRYRTPDVAQLVRTHGDWRRVPFADTSTSEAIDPRLVTIALDDALPKERVVVTDGGNFNCYPAMMLGVPDAQGSCLPLAFQSIGLSLASAIGAATARPDRVAIAGVGDGGFMMSLVELDTAVRLRLPLVAIVYNDHAYGAEVHHFGPAGEPVDIVTFPPTDVAAIARGFGCTGITVRSIHDVAQVQEWATGPRDVPLVIDCKITSFPSWLLAHTFAGE